MNSIEVEASLCLSLSVSVPLSLPRSRAPFLPLSLCLYLCLSLSLCFSGSLARGTSRSGTDPVHSADVKQTCDQHFSSGVGLFRV